MVVGVSGNWNDDIAEHRLVDAYVRCIVDNGATPLVLPCIEDDRVISDFLNHVDALLLTGGGDMDPKYWGETLTELSHKPSVKRDYFDIALTREAIDRKIRTLGICRGMQALAIVSGGKLYEDIYRQAGIENILNHSQQEPRSVATHNVIISPDSRHAEIVRCDRLRVNSFHHQAVRETNCKIAARAEDGIIEAIEGDNFIGVQWHPEELYAHDEAARMLFRWLINSKKQETTKTH